MQILVTHSVLSALSEHNKICAFVIKAQKQTDMHSGLSLSGSSGSDRDVLTLSHSSAQRLAPYLLPWFPACTESYALGVTLLLL